MGKNIRGEGEYLVKAIKYQGQVCTAAAGAVTRDKDGKERTDNGEEGEGGSR